MAVNSTHPDYDASALDWSRARDVLSGEDAVKAGGEKYLPRLDSQTDEEFSAYVKRASYFNASARTSEAYLGLIFRRPPFVKLPAAGGALSPKRPCLGWRGRLGEAALVRLRRRLHGGVEVPVRLKHHRPVTEGYCVVATRGGELPEVNCQSVTKHHRR